jgi:hypothetical protein
MTVNSWDKKDIDALLAKHGRLLRAHRGQRVVYEFGGIDLLIMHGVVCLGAEHPGFQRLSAETKQAVTRFRGFCKSVWMKQGLSSDEADILDRIRETFQEKV